VGTIRSGRRTPALLALAWLAVACATSPYALNERSESQLTRALRPDESQVERGRPHAWLDGFGHYFFSLPSKLVLLDWKIDDHDVSAEVEQALETYLHANGLCNTKVRINQYAPGGEWQRLFRNREMPGAWRYTLGVLSVSFYTIFPDRLFAGFPFIGGGDSYNPYTNTIHLYSDRRPIALHEGAHAKDFGGIRNRHWKGVYAGARSLPLAGLLVALYQEAVASNDALSWELATAGSRESKRAYRTLHPAYGTYLGGAAQSGASLFTGGWVLYAIQYGVVAAGHVSGQTRALFVREREGGLQPELLADPARPGGELPPGGIEAVAPPPDPCRPSNPAAEDAPRAPAQASLRAQK
jgi:hypothetical protein